MWARDGLHDEELQCTDEDGDNQAREWVQDWQRSRSPSGPLQAGKNGNRRRRSFLFSLASFF